MGTDRRDRLKALPAVETPRCVVGDTVREIVVLSEAEWEAIPEACRPSPAEYFPGLGWVCAAARPHHSAG